MEPAQHTEPPRSRMGIAALALVGLLISIYLTLYKLGYLGAIQCGTGGCETVQSSPWSIFLGLPVSAWGIGAYALILFLALIGLQPGWMNDRRVGVAIFLVAAVGVAFSGWLTYLEAAVIQAWCRWCVASAVVITLIFLLSLPGLGRRDGRDAAGTRSS